jgi:hypothetical protein
MFIMEWYKQNPNALEKFCCEPHETGFAKIDYEMFKTWNVLTDEQKKVNEILVVLFLWALNPEDS